ncbi:hypothetical protein MLD38_020297 [Melastoma candidum]|uniref:Uncharacterized protein n=1 Tax=Melastoma candidum TaxID=119954 RepID=A0ACB9QCI1_9MYRT|nr:hypothetical protein MLD38_020297 [Melastoma candidum]
MATFFHGQNSDIQAADGLQNLVLMNPAYVQYTSAATADAPQAAAAAAAANSLFFLNPATVPASALSHAQPPAPPTQAMTTQQFVGMPLHGAVSSQHRQDRPSSSGNAHAVHTQPHEVIPAMHGFLPRVQYGAWSSLEQSKPRRDASSLRPQQGLSLSLSSQQQQQQQQGFLHRGFGGDEREVPAVSGGSPSSVSGVTSGGGGGTGVSVLLGSKYLKAAQELLDEVANVGIGGIVKSETPRKGHVGNGKAGTGESSASAKEDGSSGGVDGKRATELSTAERQEIQMKKAKLISMLDEVEQKYRQYHHQMQIVISAFEQAAGIGSARTYTSLALQTISKQFRCLKDAISGQIRAANKSLGEDEPAGGKIEGSRLKYIDHHIRQQRALQQLGMIQHNAWRPQRGLPERSVSILRAWLFEHFLHPYPKDSDKHMLAKQTGLTRSQVSNWFINARVRLWKPMVEEMYMEEVKDQEQNGADGKVNKGEQNNDSYASKSASPPEKSLSVDNHGKSSFNPKEQLQSANLINQDAALAANSMSPVGASLQNHQLSGFSLIGSSELDGITQGASPKKPRNTTTTSDMLLSPTNVSCMNMEPNKRGEPITIKFGDDGHVHSRDGYSLLGAGPANFIGGFGQYPMAEISRFATEQQFATAFQGNGVSLTLGLPHSENLPMSGGAGAAHPGFIPGQGIHLGRRMEVGDGNEFGALNNTMPPHSSGAYEGMNMQNRKKFAAQLLPDFVT